MKRWLILMALLVGALGLATGPWVEADETGHGLSVVLKANRFRVAPDEGVRFVVGLENRGHETLRIPIACDPPAGLEILSADGSVLWSHTPECTGDDDEIVLAPGHERFWEIDWPGTSHLGEYTAWAVVQTSPRDSVAGPVPVTVSDEVEPHPTGDDPHRTPEDPHRTPEHPDPTEHPRETPHPDPTREPGHPEEPGHAGEPFPVAEWEDRQGAPDVDGSASPRDCQHLIVWLDDAEDGIFGRFVEGEWRGEPFRISGEGTPAGPPKVAYHPELTKWLVVWPERTDVRGLDLRARYVECGGESSGVFHLAPREGDDLEPAVDAFGDGFVVTWRRGEGEHASIWGAGVMGDDTRWLRALVDGAVYDPSVACQARHCFVTWTRGHEESRDVLGRRWWPGEERIDEVLEVAAGEAPEFDSAVAHAGHEAPYLAVFTRGGEHSAVFGRWIHVSGEMVVGEPFRLSGEAPAWAPDVAGAFGVYSAVWSSGREGASLVQGRRVAPGDGGHAHLGAVKTVGHHAHGAAAHPAVAPAGAHTGVVAWQWTRDRDPGDIWARYVGWGEEGERVVVLGRVLDVQRAAMAAGARPLQSAPVEVSFTVQSVLAGTFPCSQGRVYFADDAALPQDISPGIRVRIEADPVPEAACTLAVEAPGTGMSAITLEQRFAPIILKHPDRP